MAESFKHPRYYSEVDICEQFYQEISDNPNCIVLREQPIGRIRPDFLIIYDNQIQIVEAKISADLHSVRQLCFYYNIIEEYVRLEFCKSNIKIPSISMVLVAQKFDSEIFEICQSLNILLFKARPNRATECLEFDEHFFDFPEVRDDENFYKILREKFGGNNALV